MLVYPFTFTFFTASSTAKHLSKFPYVGIIYTDEQRGVPSRSRCPCTEKRNSYYLANAIGSRFTENIGRCAENIVFLELKRRQRLNPEIEIYYWKNEHHREVDFLIKEGLRIKNIIQVCWDIENSQTRKRELRTLLKAMDEFQLKQGLVITEDYNAEENIDGKVIEFINLYEWLLKNEI